MYGSPYDVSRSVEFDLSALLQKSAALVFALLIPNPLTEGIQEASVAATKGARSAAARTTADEECIMSCVES